jgi:hypothetical protein
MKYISAFFKWWKETTGLPYKTYTIGSHEIGVQWSMVALMVTFWAGMIILAWIF